MHALDMSRAELDTTSCVQFLVLALIPTCTCLFFLFFEISSLLTILAYVTTSPSHQIAQPWAHIHLIIPDDLNLDTTPDVTLESLSTAP